MVDYSLIISIIALVLSFTTSVIGILIALLTFRRRYKAILDVDLTEDKKLHLKNIGRGVATKINILFIDIMTGEKFTKRLCQILGPQKEKTIKQNLNFYSFKGKTISIFSQNRICYAEIQYRDEYSRRRDDFFLFIKNKRIENIFYTIGSPRWIFRVYLYFSTTSGRRSRKKEERRLKKEKINGINGE